jgi:hypothetical protein
LRSRALLIAFVVLAAAAAGYVASERLRGVGTRAQPVAVATARSVPDAVVPTKGDPSPAASFTASWPRATGTPGGAVAGKARRLASREPYERDDLRRLFERVLAGKLRDRELGPQDYDRLVDAALRLRGALRVLRGTEESAATARVRDEQRRVVGASLGEIEAITGLPPAELGSVLTPSADESGDDSAGGAVE